MYINFVCILVLVYFTILVTYLYFVLAVLTKINIPATNKVFVLNECCMCFSWLLICSLQYLYKRNISTFPGITKFAIINILPFLLFTLYFLLMRSGIEVNPGPMYQFRDIFADQKRNIILAHLNIQNLLSHKENKLDEIALLLKQSAQSPLVLGLSETWLSKRNATSLVTFENYRQPFRKDRNIKTNGRSKRGGGMLVYVSKLLHAKRRPDIESEIEAVWVEISGKNVPHSLVCNFYRPPQSRKPFFDVLSSQIEKAKECGLPIFLLGDLNVDLLNTTNPYIAEVSKLQKSYDLHQLISMPTRVTCSSSTLIDHIYCSNADYVIEAKSHPCPLSDHNIVYCRIVSTTEKHEKPTSVRFYHNYRKITNENLIMFFSNIYWNQYYEQKDINQKWLWLRNILLLARDSLAPKRKVRSQRRRRSDQWETQEIQELRRECNLALLRWKNSRGLAEKTDFLRKKHDLESKKLDVKSSFYKNKCTAACDSKSRWRVINDLLGKTAKSSSCEALIYNGKTIRKHSDIADVFNNFFTRVGDVNLKRKKMCLSKILASCNLEGFRFHPVSPNSVLKLLTTLNISKPAGPDELSPEFLRKVSIYIYQPLTHLFNQCITENVFPDTWKLANVTPVYKKGNSDDPSNYRPISVTSAISKIFEKIICMQLSKYLETNSLISPNQFGYREKMSTEDAIVQIVEDSKNALNQKKHTAVVFLDLSKAFDTVQHEILLQYLSKLNLGPSAVSLISNYISNRKQRVRLSGGYSDWLPLSSGVPQGSLLGPLLFLVYVNDIAKSIDKSKVISYADDTALYFSSESKSDLIKIVNTDLTRLTNYLSSLSLKVNVSKTKLLIISKSNTKDFQDVKIGKKILNPVNEADYLGITIDKNLNFKSQMQKVINRMAVANSTISHISKLINKPTRRLLYYSLVHSQLYCSTVWQYCTDKTLYRRFLRQQNWSLRLIENRQNRQSVEDLKTNRNYIPFEVCLAVSTVKFIHKLVMLNKFQSYNLHLAPRQRDTLGIQIQNCRIDSFRSSIQHRGAMIWNSLDPPIRKIKSFHGFKIKARTFLLEKYILNSTSSWCS